MVSPNLWLTLPRKLCVLVIIPENFTRAWPQKRNLSEQKVRICPPSA